MSLRSKIDFAPEVPTARDPAWKTDPTTGRTQLGNPPPPIPSPNKEIVERQKKSSEATRLKFEEQQRQQKAEQEIVLHFDYRQRRLRDATNDLAVIAERLSVIVADDPLPLLVRSVELDASTLFARASEAVVHAYILANKDKILDEYRAQTVGARQKELDEFTAANSSVLKRNGAIPP